MDILGAGFSSSLYEESIVVNAKISSLNEKLRQTMAKGDVDAFTEVWTQLVEAVEKKDEEDEKNDERYFTRHRWESEAEWAVEYFCAPIAEVVFEKMRQSGGRCRLLHPQNLTRTFLAPKEKKPSVEALAFFITKHLKDPTKGIIPKDSGWSGIIGGGDDDEPLMSQMIGSFLTLAHKDHAKYRDLLSLLDKKDIEIFLRSPKKMASVMSFWGKGVVRDVSYEIFSEDIDFEFIESLAPFMDKVWPHLLEVESYRTPYNSFFWQEVLKNCPLVRKSHEDFSLKAYQQNQRREEIIEAQWPDGAVPANLYNLYASSAQDLGSGRPVINQKSGLIPTWWINLYARARPPEDGPNTDTLWREEEKIKPPARLYTSLGAYFLTTENIQLNSLMKAIENNDPLVKELAKPENANVLMKFLRKMDQDDFLRVVRAGHLNDVCINGMSLTEHFVDHHCISSLHFAQRLNKISPDFFEDGKVLALMVNYGMTKSTEVRFSKMRMKNSLKENGIKLTKSKKTETKRRM